jgi:hypothetical protein
MLQQFLALTRGLFAPLAFLIRQLLEAARLAQVLASAFLPIVRTRIAAPQHQSRSLMATIIEPR